MFLKRISTILYITTFQFFMQPVFAEELQLPSANQEEVSSKVDSDLDGIADVDGDISASDIEFDTQTDTFLKYGYENPTWINNGPLLDKVYNELAAPDYKDRYNKPNPMGYGIEIAQAYITRRGFNDLIIASRMPGDCNEDGCLFQIYSLIGHTWYKQLEFHAHDIVFKHGEGEKTSFVAGVAEETGVSKVYYWNGENFIK
jgi:hypothetical protein